MGGRVIQWKKKTFLKRHCAHFSDLSLPPPSPIFSCYLPSCPRIFPSHPNRFHFLWLSWHPLKNPKNPRFKPACFILVVCHLGQLMNFPEPQFLHLLHEGIGAHLRFEIYSNQGDIHTPAHCALQSLFARLHASLHPHPRATWQTSRQLKYLPASLPCVHAHHTAF